MNEVLSYCSGADLTALLTTVDVPPEAIILLERVPTRWLDPNELENVILLANFDAATAWTDWESGRIFCKTWELRWELNHAKPYAIYTGVSIDLPNFTSGPDLSSYTRQERSYFLWGRRLNAEDSQAAGLPPDQPAFFESQIPRILRYPLEVIPRKRLKLLVAEWFSNLGELIAWRCIGLEGE